METDELRGIAETERERRISSQTTRWAWLRSYVRNRVDEKLEPGALERALGELRAEPGAPVTDGD
jgi:hypothetical protein